MERAHRQVWEYGHSISVETRHLNPNANPDLQSNVPISYGLELERVQTSMVLNPNYGAVAGI
jgi:hypothetical protein